MVWLLLVFVDGRRVVDWRRRIEVQVVAEQMIVLQMELPLGAVVVETS